MRRWVITAIVIVAIIGAGLYWRSTRTTADATTYLTAAATTGTVVQQIASTGTVAPALSLNLAFGGSSSASSSNNSGNGQGLGGNGSSSGSSQSVSSGSTAVKTVSIKVGEQVVAGQTLATLDPTTANSQLTSANAQIASAKAKQASEPSGTSAATLASDAVAVAQAEQQVLSAQQALDATQLKAPVAGVVTAVNISVGLPPTSPAITMRSNTLVVVASVSETSLSSLSAGQHAVITFPALSRSGTGVVAGLPTAASSSSSGSSAVTFPVTITLTSFPSGLLPGMTAQIAIVVATRVHVIAVPTTAIQGSTNAPTVQVLESGKPVSKPVTVGLSTNSNTEILAGVAVGEKVVTGVVTPTTTTTTTGGGLGGGLGSGLGGGTGRFPGGGGFGNRPGSGAGPGG